MALSRLFYEAMEQQRRAFSKAGPSAFRSALVSGFVHQSQLAIDTCIHHTSPIAGQVGCRAVRVAGACRKRSLRGLLIQRTGACWGQ